MPFSTRRKASMDGEDCARVDSMAGDIAQHDQEQEPEIGPVLAAFRLKTDHGAPGIVAGIVAMLFGEIGGQTIHVACTQLGSGHAPLPERYLSTTELADD